MNAVLRYPYKQALISANTRTSFLIKTRLLLSLEIIATTTAIISFITYFAFHFYVCLGDFTSFDIHKLKKYFEQTTYSLQPVISKTPRKWF